MDQSLGVLHRVPDGAVVKRGPSCLPAGTRRWLCTRQTPPDRIAVAEVSESVDAPSDLASRPLNAEMLEAADIHDLHGADLPWKSLKSYVLLFLNGVLLADLVSETPKLIGDNTHDSDPVYPVDMGSTVRH